MAVAERIRFDDLNEDERLVLGELEGLSPDTDPKLYISTVTRFAQPKADLVVDSLFARFGAPNLPTLQLRAFGA